ncbi:Hypothetical protein FKW44_016336 [Caligus rogercresseyi]|uniref:Uncharacterized protein n=1 Tax=Caligus rogercresseyi TaxID=217165 RepID=A0A7T8H1S1_CALRO|nr:Hypothetical protein FKW44_016336 [Caligus rogercresseyi]
MHEPSLVPVQLPFHVLLGIGNFGLFRMPAIVFFWLQFLYHGHCQHHNIGVYSPDYY